jgi:hypothetical protein
VKRSNRRRLPEAAPSILDKFRGGFIGLAGRFITSSAIGHSGDKGASREKSLQDFLRKVLPNRYGVTKGQVVDIKDIISPSIDILIYDQTRIAPFIDEATSILPAESILASIEVKSTLSVTEIRTALLAASAFRRLMPFGRPEREQNVEAKTDDFARFFHCVFAYSTDLAGGDLTKEMERFSRVCAEEGVSTDVVDRIYIGNVGLIHPQKSIGITDESLQAFRAFFLNLLNFLNRENSRRGDIPYNAYFGRQQWINLKGTRR